MWLAGGSWSWWEEDWRCDTRREVSHLSIYFPQKNFQQFGSFWNYQCSRWLQIKTDLLVTLASGDWPTTVGWPELARIDIKIVIFKMGNQGIGCTCKQVFVSGQKYLQRKQISSAVPQTLQVTLTAILKTRPRMGFIDIWKWLEKHQLKKWKARRRWGGWARLDFFHLP